MSQAWHVATKLAALGSRETGRSELDAVKARAREIL
jgi:hypothetical protein